MDKQRPSTKPTGQVERASADLSELETAKARQVDLAERTPEVAVEEGVPGREDQPRVTDPAGPAEDEA